MYKHILVADLHDKEFPRREQGGDVYTFIEEAHHKGAIQPSL